MAIRITLVFLFSLALAGRARAAEGFNKETCSFNGVPLRGDVQVVESFPDLNVEIVESFPGKCGQWKIVESFADIKIQYVDSFPDLKIRIVTSFPGVP